MRCIFLWYENQLDQSKRVCSCVFAGGGVPHLAWGGGAEMCVVISCQRQGQVYLCDTADLGPSAHSRHPHSESCAGNLVPVLEHWNVWHFYTEQMRFFVFLPSKNLKVFSVLHLSEAVSDELSMCHYNKWLLVNCTKVKGWFRRTRGDPQSCWGQFAWGFSRSYHPLHSLEWIKLQVVLAPPLNQQTESMGLHAVRGKKKYCFSLVRFF